LATNSIVEKSAGVFLWARFAVQEVIDTVCNGGAVELPLQTIIDRMPSELEQVYARIFRSFKNDDSKRACGLMLQLIDAAQQDLQLTTLFEAMLVAGDSFRPLTEMMGVKDLDNFERRICAVGGGLVEIIPDAPLDSDGATIGNSYVAKSTRIIHRTVQTYLGNTGWIELLDKPLALGSQQRLWIETCTSFLAGKRVKWARQNRGTVQPSSVLLFCLIYRTNLYREPRPSYQTSIS
jgi:hypothetical protein